MFAKKIQIQTVIREKLHKALSYEKGARKMLMKLRPDDPQGFYRRRRGWSRTRTWLSCASLGLRGCPCPREGRMGSWWPVNVKFAVKSTRTVHPSISYC